MDPRFCTVDHHGFYRGPRFALNPWAPWVDPRWTMAKVQVRDPSTGKIRWVDSTETTEAGAARAAERPAPKPRSSPSPARKPSAPKAAAPVAAKPKADDGWDGFWDDDDVETADEE